MEAVKRELVCPNCGKEISVPAELEVFSCVYCGEKLKLSELLPMPDQQPDEKDLAFVETHLFDCIRDYPNYYRNFTRKNYESSFRTYEEEIADTYLAMDRCVCAAPFQREALLNKFAEEFMDSWESYHSAAAAGRRKAAAEKQMIFSRMTLAWYAIPAIRDLKLSVSDAYTDRLIAVFNRKYPDGPITAASYTDLLSGFRKRGLCFITTAVCAYEGKPDDCAELTAFRTFRDTWLARTEAGRALIEAYYDLAPAIVQAIGLCGRPDEVYPYIRRTYLEPCYAALQSGQPETCCSIYKSMVTHLKERCHLQEIGREMPS